MTGYCKSDFPILFDSTWTKSGLADAITVIDPAALCREYRALAACAPRRRDRGKKYFVGHSGVTSSRGYTNRREEHYAVALVNLDETWPRPHGGRFRLLDYQVPLKSRRTDAGLGKIDLVGLTDQGRLMVIELKVKPDGGNGEPPPLALMEGLRYAAVVEANLLAIEQEVKERYGRSVAGQPPIVQLLAPSNWWRGWCELPHDITGDWSAAFSRLAGHVASELGVAIECAALDDRTKLTLGLDGSRPRLDRVPALHPVEFV